MAPYCNRCKKPFDIEENQYDGLHWSCLTYDERQYITRMEQCRHKETYTAKICADCSIIVK